MTTATPYRARPASAAIACCAMFAISSVCAGSVDVRKVVQQGDPVPDIPGVTFSSILDEPEINDAGAVVIRGFLDTGQSGVFLFQNNQLLPIAVSGDPAPGLPGVTIAGVGVPRIGDDGTVAFKATLVRTGDVTMLNDEVLYATPPGASAPELLIREGGAAPGAGSFVFGGNFSDPIVTSEGDVVFSAFVTENGGITSLSAIYTRRDGVLTRDVLAGDPLPAPLAGNFTGILSIGQPISDDGDYLISASLPGIVAVRDGQPTTVLDLNAPAPGFPGATVQFALSTLMSPGGEVSFPAFLTNNELVLYIAGDAGFTVLAQADTPAPGTGVDYSIFGPAFVSTTGEAAFGALLNAPPPNNGAVFITQSSVIELLVRQGDPAPGFDGLTIRSATPLAFNAQNDLVYLANISPSDSGIYFYDASAQTTVPLVFEGEELDVNAGTGAPADPREITNVFTNTPNRLFNDSSALAVRLSFLGSGDGVYIFNTQPPTAGGPDLNGDGMVDLTDLLACLASFGTDAGGDTDNDGDTDLNDLLAILAAFGT